MAHSWFWEWLNAARVAATFGGGWRILAFAERVLPRAADLWVQASLKQRQRFQQLFFSDGVTFDGNGFVGTAVTAPAFSYLQAIGVGNERVVDLTGIEPVTS